MLRTATILILIFALTGFRGGNNGYRKLSNDSFSRGEVMKYRAFFGFITAGEGTMRIQNNIRTVNGRKCYKIDVFGETTGLADVIYKVRDYWGTYIDTTSIIPHKFERDIKEGKYRKLEEIIFDHLNDSVSVKTYKYETKELERDQRLSVPDNVQDLVSGYYYLRTVDFTKLNVGDTIKVDAIFEDELYDFKSIFRGREEIKTKLGYFDALVISPIMPDNSIFDGEDAVQLWMSNDKNKIPLKVSAKMWMGSVGLEITEYTKGKD